MVQVIMPRQMVSEFILLYNYVFNEYTHGRVAKTVEFAGIPLFSPAKLLTSWCTAAFAMPYPIIPNVEIGER